MIVSKMENRDGLKKAPLILSSDEVLKTKLPKGFMFKNIGKFNRSPKWVMVPLTGSFMDRGWSRWNFKACL